jgi:hypothetical protein
MVLLSNHFRLQKSRHFNALRNHGPAWPTKDFVKNRLCAVFHNL